MHQTTDIITKKPNAWDDFFTLANTATLPDDFMATRDNSAPQERDLFNGLHKALAPKNSI